MRDYLIGVIRIPKVDRTPEHFGSIDMGNVSHVVPAVHVFGGCNPRKTAFLTYPRFSETAATPYVDETILQAGKALAVERVMIC